MTEIDINIPHTDDVGRTVDRVERVMRGYGLNQRLRGTFKRFPGSLHWHFNKPGETGTLEVTLWPARRRLWFKIQSGRRAAWIEQLLPILKRELERPQDAELPRDCNEG